MSCQQAGLVCAAFVLIAGQERLFLAPISSTQRMRVFPMAAIARLLVMPYTGLATGVRFST